MGKNAFLILACGVLLTAGAGELPLALRGAPAAYTIVVPAAASPSQRYAAEELRDYTEKMTGVKLPIVTDAEPLPAKAVLIGGTKYTDIKADVGTDGFRLVARPPHLLVIGSPDRGALYGVYELLERFGGCRWYASWCEKVPRRDRFAVPDTLDDTQVPAFAMREPFWWDVLQNGAFAARLRVNSRSWRQNEEKFGGTPFRFGGGLASCHTFNLLLPPEKYFDAHPEYFSMVKGQRLKHPSQLCLTNPDVLRIVTSNVLARIRRDPGAKFYGVSQNDWYNYCECPACKAIDDEEESHAGTMVRFVNAVAEAVEKEFPNALIETLAYQYTRKPPKKTRLRHNVIPCLCTIECDFAQPIDVSPYKHNISFRDDIRGWAKQTDLLYVWDYTTDFRNYTMPFPNVYALQGNVKFFHANGVKCLFEQGAYQGRHGDFAELKSWLLAKWMWNPELPMKPLLDDFFAGYYGKAAPYVRDYFEAIHKMQRFASSFPNKPLRIFDSVADSVLPDEFLGFAAGCWEQALDAVKDDPATSYNARMAAFSFDFLRLERLRLKTDKVLVFARKSGAADDLAKAQGLAKSLLARMAEAKNILLAESASRHEQLLKEWRELVARSSVAAISTTSGEVEEHHISLAKKGTWGDFADDPKAADGKALKLFNTHFEWCATFQMHRIAFEPGAKYKVRVRVRVDKLRDGGEAFWAGVYDPVAKVGRGGIQPRTEKTSSDYAWYDVCTWVPNEREYFWIGPGRFGKDGKSSIQALWIDKIDFTRVDVAQPVAEASRPRDAVLLVCAHPDDLEGCLGLALLMRSKYAVQVVDFTRGEGGCGEAGYLDGSTAVKRIAEERSICKALGCDPIFLSQINFRGRAYAEPYVTAELERIIVERRPKAVFAHWPVDTHPDHVQCSAAVQHALFNVKRDHGFSCELYFFEETVQQTMNFHPQYYVDISPVMSEATELIGRYVCQNGTMLAENKKKRTAAHGRSAPRPVKFAEPYATFSGKPLRGGVLEEFAIPGNK